MNIPSDADSTSKKRLCFGINSIQYPDRLLLTDWDRHRLNCVVAHLQILHWHEMPTNTLFNEILYDDDIHELLLQLYPAHVWRLGDEPAFMQTAPEHEANPLCLDTGENWDYLGAEAYETCRREVQDSVFWSPYSYEEQRDIMLRHLYTQAKQKYPPSTGRLPLVQLARALFIGEIGERMDLTTLGGKKLEYTLREFARGCDRLYDPDAAATVAATIVRLTAEGNIPMLRSLIIALEEKLHGFVAFCATDETAAPAKWLDRWTENSIRLRADAEAAIATVRKRDAEEIAVLAQRFRDIQDGGNLPACPSMNNVFRDKLEHSGLDVDALWLLMMRCIAAEIPLIRDETIVRFLRLNWSFSEDLAVALQGEVTPEEALAQVIHQWCKGWELTCCLRELEERFPPLFFEDDSFPDFDDTTMEQDDLDLELLPDIIKRMADAVKKP